MQAHTSLLVGVTHTQTPARVRDKVSVFHLQDSTPETCDKQLTTQHSPKETRTILKSIGLGPRKPHKNPIKLALVSVL